MHPTTVSRVLNGEMTLKIRPETRDRVLQVADELRYRPNAVARGLRLSASGALGLLIPTLRNPVFSQIIRGAFARAWEQGFVVVLAEDAGGDDASQAYERLVGEGRIDGLLVASVRPGHPLLDHEIRDQVATVFVNRRDPTGGPSVSMREEDAGALAAQHLLGLGHERLAHIAGPPGLDTADRRSSGFVDAAEAAGAHVMVRHASFDEPGGFAAMQHLLDVREARPTATFVSTFNQAVGALAGAHALSARVPADMSVITNDADPFTEYLEPPLTAIKMPLAELGATAVDCLLEQIRTGARPSAVISTAPELVVRASTCPP